MKSVTPILLSTFFFVYVNFSYAATESTNVKIEVIHDEYVKLVGSAVGVSRTFSVEDVKPPSGSRPKIALGVLGLESNLAGNCTLNISTLNTFKLKHTVSNKRLTRYKLFYKGKTIRKNKNTTMTLPCSSSQSNLEFKSVGAFLNNIKSGIYSDTITLTVTTQ